jgi:hypothetical protein
MKRASRRRYGISRRIRCVKRVIGIDNNSRDGTAEAARLAGAEVIVEQQSGYGRCVWRALAEGSRLTDTEVEVALRR